MSITVESQPDYTKIINPFNDIPFIVSSDETAQPNFSFLATCYVNTEGVFDAAKAGIGELDRATFDFKSIIESYLSYSFSSVNTLRKNEGACVTAGILFGERYDGEDYYPEEDPIEYVVLNTSLTYNEFQSSTISTIDLSNAGTSFLTTRRSDRRGVDEVDWLSFFYGSSAAALTNIVFKKYNSAGTLLATNNVTLGTLEENSIYSFGAGPLNVRQQFGDSFLSGVAYYTVQIDGVSELFRYTIVERCNGYEVIDLIFINKYGVVDTFTFDLLSREESQITKATATVSRGGVNTTTGAYESGELKQIVKPYNIVVEDSLSLNSNWCTDEQAVFLKELFTSPAVWGRRGAIYEPYSVQNQPYNKKKVVNDWLFNYTINLTAQQKSRRQNG